MLQFENAEDFASKVHNLANMTTIRSSEVDPNFKSFANIAKEVYNSANFEEFTKQELEDFVETNSQFIHLVTDKDGEIYVEPILDNSIYKHIVNEDRMYQIADTVYKVLDKGVISVHKRSINQLANLQEMNEENMRSSEILSYTPHQIEIETRVVDCPAVTNRYTKGRERVKIELEKEYYGPDYMRSFKVGVRSKPYRRMLIGIWYNKTRRVTYHYILSGIDKHNSSGTMNVNGTVDTDELYEWVFNGPAAYFFQVTKHHSWASTPEISPGRVEIRQNM